MTELQSNGVSLDERIAQLLPLYGEQKAEQKAREEFAMKQAKKAALAPPGSLKLPPLLEEKRLRYEMPDACFKWQASYDRCFAYQVPTEKENFHGGSIIAPDTTRAYEERVTPKVVIVSAGLRALDNLRSNGIDIGHTVVTNQMVPYRFEVGLGVDNKMASLLIIRDGDICGSLELMQAIKDGECGIVQRMCKDANANEFVEHVFKDRGGHLWQPETPWISDDG